MPNFCIEEALLITEKRRIAQKIFAHLQRHLGGFLGAKFALAISGGLDSRALMEAVALWPRRSASEILIVTVNHQTRRESEDECKAVFARAIALGFEAEIVTVFLGSKKDEATMRKVRYEAIWKRLVARRINVLCTAHQKDDDAEGVVMDLFGFGGGSLGAGMKAKKSETNGLHLRPFLGLERRDLLLFLSSINATDYLRDPSNKDGSSARQKARDFLDNHAPHLHPSPVKRLSTVANLRLQQREMTEALSPKLFETHSPSANSIEIELRPELPVDLLRRQLKSGYEHLCPNWDPRNASPCIEILLKKATGLGLIGVSGVDPRGNSITLGEPVRMNFDLPGAKALMTPRLVSLFRI